LQAQQWQETVQDLRKQLADVQAELLKTQSNLQQAQADNQSLKTLSGVLIISRNSIEQNTTTLLQAILDNNT